MEETWFDGGYNSKKNIAFAHVEMCLISHYHIDKDWKENVYDRLCEKSKIISFA